MDETMMAMAPQPRSADDPAMRLSSTELRRLVELFVGRRVPAADAEDVVQTVLCAALGAQRIPEDAEELRRWLVGIARHKVADYHRQQKGARLVELDDQIPGDASPLEAREWARWAEGEVPDSPEAKRTLGWMAREGAGDKLAHIAEEEQIPADRVRQRVSRLRRLFRQRWQAELAAVAAVIGMVLLGWYLLRQPEHPVAVPIGPEPSSVLTASAEAQRLERAAKLRMDALRECERSAWQPCLAGLDEAAGLDPAGDAQPEVQRARERIREALTAPPEPKLAPSSEPAPSSIPPPRPSSTMPSKSDPAPTLPSPPATTQKPGGGGKKSKMDK